jgi:hypothetical protein
MIVAYRIESSVTVNAPAEAIWNLIQEPERRLEWDARITGVTLLTPRPIGKGARTRVDYRMWGFPMTIEIEMISWAPPYRSGVKGVVVGTTDTIGASWNITSNDDGTSTWTTKLVMTSKGPFAWLREQIAGRTTAYLTRVSQRNAKRVLEAERRPAIAAD